MWGFSCKFGSDLCFLALTDLCQGFLDSVKQWGPINDTEAFLCKNRTFKNFNLFKLSKFYQFSKNTIWYNFSAAKFLSLVIFCTCYHSLVCLRIMYEISADYTPKLGRLLLKVQWIIILWCTEIIITSRHSGTWMALRMLNCVVH